jgi:hypothetical protein
MAFGPFVIPGWAVVGGTSVGAPIIAAMYGLNGGAVGNYGVGGDPWNGYGSDPYAFAGAWAYFDNPNLNEITSGSNGSCGGSYLCTAGPFPPTAVRPVLVRRTATMPLGQT